MLTIVPVNGRDKVICVNGLETNVIENKVSPECKAGLAFNRGPVERKLFQLRSWPRSMIILENVTLIRIPGQAPSFLIRCQDQAAKEPYARSRTGS